MKGSAMFRIETVIDKKGRKVWAVVRITDNHPIFSDDSLGECRGFLRLVMSHIYNGESKCATA